MNRIWVVGLVAACASARRPVVQRADQLPQHVVRVPAHPSILLDDDRAFASFSAELRRDLEMDLATYDIRDHATMRDHLFELAMLDALDGNLPAAVARLDRASTFADKPAERRMIGLTIRVLANAHGGDVRTSLVRELDSMPYDLVEDELKKLRAIVQIVTPRFAHGIIETDVGPAAQAGSVSIELAEKIVFQRWLVTHVVPVAKIYDDEIAARLAAHAHRKPDIWAPRDITVTGGTPVAIGVWDTGVDTSLFPGRVDGVLAWDLAHQRTDRPLLEIPDPARLPAQQTMLVGVLDVQANVESDAASTFRHTMGDSDPSLLPAMFEELDMLGKYVHGTHVASIAMRDNAAAHLVVVRNTWDWHVKVRVPTLAEARAWAQQYKDAIRFFQDHHVRVVNMSWDMSAAEIEGGLEANNAGGRPSERRALAKQLYAIHAAAMRDAMTAAPEILFVAAAGNSNDDATFRGSLPIELGLPNVLAVGAVDQAGDEAPFTSPGTVYANGYEVRGLFPGGTTVAMSGTSMAAPQVTNLAGKLLAETPSLTTEELRRAIVDGAASRRVGDRTLRTIDAKHALELATRVRRR